MTHTQYQIPSHYLAAIGDRFMQRAGRPGQHRGTDFAPDGGGTAVSFAAGVVVTSRWSPGMGNVVEIQHADGKVSGLGHLASRAVRVGDGVPMLGEVGQIGNTGRYSKGRHLHYTLGDRPGAIFEGTVHDVLAYAAQRTAPAATATASTWEWWVPDAGLQKRIQKALKARRRYFGPADGAWGRESVKGIQRTIQGVGYPGLVDGIAGELTCTFVQKYAEEFGDYDGPLDRKLGPYTWAGFALGLERP